MAIRALCFTSSHARRTIFTAGKPSQRTNTVMLIVLMQAMVPRFGYLPFVAEQVKSLFQVRLSSPARVATR